MKDKDLLVWLNSDIEYDSDMHEYVSELRHYSFNLVDDRARYEGEFIRYNERDDLDGFIRMKELKKQPRYDFKNTYWAGPADQ